MIICINDQIVFTCSDLFPIEQEPYLSGFEKHQKFVFFNIVHDVRLQKISISTPGKVNGNSKQEGVSKAKIFVGKYEAKPEFSGGGGSN